MIPQSKNKSIPLHSISPSRKVKQIDSYFSTYKFNYLYKLNSIDKDASNFPNNPVFDPATLISVSTGDN